MKVVVLEVGDKLWGTGNRAVIFLLHSLSTGARNGALALKWWVSLLRVLGTQPLPIGALFSLDHSCDNRGLGHFIDDQKSGGRGQVWRKKNICVFWLSGI